MNNQRKSSALLPPLEIFRRYDTEIDSQAQRLQPCPIPGTMERQILSPLKISNTIRRSACDIAGKLKNVRTRERERESKNACLAIVEFISKCALVLIGESRRSWFNNYDSYRILLLSD